MFLISKIDWMAFAKRVLFGAAQAPKSLFVLLVTAVLFLSLLLLAQATLPEKNGVRRLLEASVGLIEPIASQIADDMEGR